MNILVTGGTGFIGSHACVVLMQAGHQVVILDNLSNSDVGVVDRIGSITGTAPTLVVGDIRDAKLLKEIFEQYSIDAVMHFAGLKAVGESVSAPLMYWDCNVTGTITLLSVMSEMNVKNFVFSSSATVYGEPDTVPISEDANRKATNPYGHTKLVIEHILENLVAADPQWRIACLRYFNPVGAHDSGVIGEAPQGVPNNLMPYVTQVAMGIREELSVFGNDYSTCDGTGVRDYIHVMDLVEGHLAALEALSRQPGLLAVNLGTGNGVSVLQILQAFENASGKQVPYKIVNRRPGDVAACFADTSKAKAIIDWTAKRDLQKMCEDAWRWEQFQRGNTKA